MSKHCLQSRMCSNVLWLIMYYIQLYNKNSDSENISLAKASTQIYGASEVRYNPISTPNYAHVPYTMVFTSHTLVIPQLPSAAMGECIPSCVTDPGSDQGSSQALGSDPIYNVSQARNFSWIWSPKQLTWLSQLVSDFPTPIARACRKRMPCTSSPLWLGPYTKQD